MNNTFPTHHTIPELIEKYGLPTDNATLALQQYGTEQTAVVTKLLEVKQAALIETLRDLRGAQFANISIETKLKAIHEKSELDLERATSFAERLWAIHDVIDSGYNRQDRVSIKNILSGTINPVATKINDLQAANDLLNKQVQGMCEANTRLEEQLRLANEKLINQNKAIAKAKSVFMELVAYNHIADNICPSVNDVIDELHNAISWDINPIRDELTAKDATIENLASRVVELEDVLEDIIKYSKKHNLSLINTIAIEALKNK